MGKYIALHLAFDAPHREIDVLRGAFRARAFAAKAIGALGRIKASKENVFDGFMSGWGLEVFGSSKQSALKGRSITTVAVDPQNEAYLADVVAKVHRATLLRREFPPFETRDEQYGVTFLNTPDLGLAPVEVCGLWGKEFDPFPVHLYGTFHLAVNDPGPHDWRNAYESLYDYPPEITSIALASPYILLSAVTSPEEPNVTSVMLMASSLVWLHNGNALNGHVGSEEADENLLRLADLVECLVNHGNTQLRHASLSVDGNLFLNELDRIKEAFVTVVPSLEVDL